MKRLCITVAMAGTVLAGPFLAGSAQAQSTSDSSSTSSSSSGSQSGAAASNAGNAQTITNNSYTPARQTIVAAPSVYTPALTTTLTETCMGSSSLGVSVLGFGAAGGTTWTDKQCVRRLNARELAQTLNDREAAREVMCGDPDIFRVYNALGRPCRLRPDGSLNPDWKAPPEPPAAPPPPPPPMAPQAKAVHYTVYFDLASAALTAQATRTLDETAATVLQNGPATVLIAGHTDRSGTIESNAELSKQRALAVKAYLISKGVPEDQQKVMAMGESMPAVPTPDGVPEARNRRVEIMSGPGSGM
jgi:outer membrane protein OmpA-like peptidoglycan-associated protein